MNRVLSLALALGCVAAPSAAQGTKAPAKKDSAKGAVHAPATKAPAGTKAPSTKTDTRQSAPATSGAKQAPATKADVKQAPVGNGAKADTKAPSGNTAKADTKQATSGNAAKPDAKQAGKGVPPTSTKAAPGAANTKAPAAGAPAAAPVQAPTPTIMREVFTYQQEGRRDPFATLLTSSDLRPTLADLRLTGVLYDENGNNSIAVMRDVGTNALYRVTTGQTLGRMKVALIKRKAVIFSIQAFGVDRQDSLVLG
ncbi:MAG TPA: hypothetical protein VF483_03105, partial [Gemmatimonadaceae bacterium]